MKTISLQPDFNAWRDAARSALLKGYQPEEIDFQDCTSPHESILFAEVDSEPTGAPTLKPHATAPFLNSASDVSAHRDPARWNLLYRVLYRLQSNRNLLKIETDADVSEMLRLRSQVRRDVHKMHAFVRFHKVSQPNGTVTVSETSEARQAGAAPAGRTPLSPDNAKAFEQYLAWYKPDNRILALAAPFFVERFAVLSWTILTPDASVSWDPVLRELSYGEGVPLSAPPGDDEVEALWRSYYQSIYNPARLNLSAMRSEMPIRYWKNLPEIATLPALITQSAGRVALMLSDQQERKSAAAYVPAMHTIEAIREALPSCKGCELYCHATQVVPGGGSRESRIVLIGEQPGDQEDLHGLPFVGPAGSLLDQILKELGLERTKIYVTNAVKHFKFVQRGKFRLHQNPRMSEITACRPWLLAELDALQPEVVVCLGASAAKSIFGGTFQLMKSRGKILSSPYADRVIATIHPSAILRAGDEGSQAQMRLMLKADLTLALNWKNG